MQLPLQDFTTLVRNMAASVQGSARVLIDLTTGSVLRAVLEANASAALWLQWIAVQVLSATRAATSTGGDLDSWVADFGLSRLPGQAASVTLSFSRYTPGFPTAIPVGAQVKTSDAKVAFAVTADPTNPALSSDGLSYAVAALAGGIDLPATASLPGSAGNVGANSISLLATAIPGIDAVTNATAASGGFDAEADTALRARFANFIDSRSRATPEAVAFAIQSLQQGLTHVLSENLDAAGNARPGSCVVTVDDGSGSPPPSLLGTVGTALEAVRPVGTQFTVQAPTLIPASISLTITTPPTSFAAAQQAAAAAVRSYVASLAIGEPLPVTRLAAVAYAADPDITNVGEIAINGGGDLSSGVTGIIRPSAVTVS